MTTKVQVATTRFNEPIPGVLVNTEMGDVIFVHDRPTGTVGIHAPGNMIMNEVLGLLELVYHEYMDAGLVPFEPDDTAPLIVEEDFIFQQLWG